MTAAITSDSGPHLGAGTLDGHGGTPDGSAVPVRADGVELIGPMEGSGYREPPCLARRGDGQVVQLTPLLYAVLESMDGRRDLEALATEVSDRVGKQATASDMSFLVEEKLRPLGLLRGPDGSQPQLRKAEPLLALKLRMVVSNPKTTRALTAPFALLFAPAIVVVTLIAFAAAVGWLLFGEGLAGSARQLLYNPELLLLVFFLTAVSAGFHEFGHAAACRYGGATPGAMGAGLYLVWPAFYTDVTDSYRLDRRSRLRVDLGGLYFNAIFSLASIGVWAITGWTALLILVPLQLLQMVHQLLPFVRLDGYHILADLTGVPDLFARIKPVLDSAVPGHDARPEVAGLKPWVRVVVTAWVLLVIPILLFSMLMMAITLPRVAATAWDSLSIRGEAIGRSWDRGELASVAVGVLGASAILLPVLSTVYLLSRLARRLGVGAWHRTEERPWARRALLVGAPALAAGLAWLWWPNGEYRPIQAGERGTLLGAAEVVEDLSTGRPGLTSDRAEELGGAPFRSDDPAPSTTTTTTTSTTTTVAPAPATTPTTTRPATAPTSAPPPTTAPTPEPVPTTAPPATTAAPTTAPPPTTVAPTGGTP